MAGVSTLCLAVLLTTGVAALEFDMLYQTKCIMEEMDENVIVLGEYATMRGAARTPVPVDVKVYDPHEAMVFQQGGKPKGTFGFTAKSAGDYKACFTTRDAATAKDTKVSLEWKTGVSATNWDEVAKKENLDLMATELRKLEDSVKEVHNEMLYLRRREEQMRNLNESTNERVALFSIASLVFVVGLGAWQLWYLRSFFHRKKLL